MACLLTRKPEIQIRIQGSIKESHVHFVKKHASNCTKIRSQQILNVKGHFLSFEIS